LWRHGVLTVADIRGLLPDAPPLAYTTVMTMLDQLHRKGLVDRRKSGRAFRYTARVSAAEVRRELAAAFLAHYFDSDPGLLADLLPPSSAAPGRRLPPARPRPASVARREPDREPPGRPAVDEDESYLL
jgi:hypothetical protein